VGSFTPQFERVGAPSPPKPLAAEEIEQFAQSSLSTGFAGGIGGLKELLIQTMIDGKYPIGAVTKPIKIADGKMMTVVKFVVPGSLVRADVYREDETNWRWKPKAGRGKWIGQSITFKPIDTGFFSSLGQIATGWGRLYSDLPNVFKQALGSLCQALEAHPEAGMAADIAAMSGGAPPGSGQQAIDQAKNVCAMLFPPPAPGLPAPPPPLPAGSITTQDNKTGMYRVAIPIGSQNPAGGVNGLGATSVTHLELAPSPTLPNGAAAVTRSEFEKRTGTGSIWRNPSTYVAGGSLLCGAAVLGVALHRRRR
jgi:hypothetical protein